MTTILKVTYIITFIGFIGGILIEWMNGNHIVWPTLGLFWAYQSFKADIKLNTFHSKN